MNRRRRIVVSDVVRFTFAASAATCAYLLILLGLALREMDDPQVLAHPQLFAWLTTAGFVVLAVVTASLMYRALHWPIAAMGALAAVAIAAAIAVTAPGIPLHVANFLVGVTAVTAVAAFADWLAQRRGRH